MTGEIGAQGAPQDPFVYGQQAVDPVLQPPQGTVFRDMPAEFNPSSRTADHVGWLRAMGYEDATAAKTALEAALDKLPEADKFLVEAELGFLKNVAEMWRQRCAEMAAAAGKDPLTGLYGRASFEGAIRRLETDPSKAFCCLDALNLTLANNTGGHAVGDQLLMRGGRSLELAAAWCNDLTVVDIDGVQLKDSPQELVPARRLFHQSGDEFAAIVENVLVACPEANPETGASELSIRSLPEVFLERVTHEFGTIMFYGTDMTREGGPVMLGVSSLVGGYAAGGEGAAEQADKAAFQAKTAARRPILNEFLSAHKEPTADVLGRTIQIQGNVVTVDGVVTHFDQLMLDKLTAISPDSQR